ncbi:hypothetical protein HPB50_025318 [Hyalomma asiaticum]|uniref:Uncharacterized protein n=1 Tax=Hyalomma asiaticum TaxID=266040 RepID=A0ACB7SSZ4_HYAAI|nr:hypothetical protein HPB50_025318 [Hyalomma asiaticum]
MPAGKGKHWVSPWQPPARSAASNGATARMRGRCRGGERVLPSRSLNESGVSLLLERCVDVFGKLLLASIKSSRPRDCAAQSTTDSESSRSAEIQHRTPAKKKRSCQASVPQNETENRVELKDYPPLSSFVDVVTRKLPFELAVILSIVTTSLDPAIAFTCFLTVS